MILFGISVQEKREGEIKAQIQSKAVQRVHVQIILTVFEVKSLNYNG